MITQERLKELLNYNPDTGVFTWIKDRGHTVKAGDLAGCVITFPHNNKSYAHIRVDRVLYRSHRLAWVYVYGCVDDKYQMDHINNDSLDNRIVNLRPVTAQDNCMNKGKYKNNTSGVTGVYSQSSGSWWAEISYKNTTYYLGTFKTIEEAAYARQKKKDSFGFTELHGV